MKILSIILVIFCVASSSFAGVRKKTKRITKDVNTLSGRVALLSGRLDGLHSLEQSRKPSVTTEARKVVSKLIRVEAKKNSKKAGKLWSGNDKLAVRIVSTIDNLRRDSPAHRGHRNQLKKMFGITGDLDLELDRLSDAFEYLQDTD